jgi:hypothetical protein
LHTKVARLHQGEDFLRVMMIRNKEMILRIALLTALSILFAFELFHLFKIATNLRPAADDYCLAGIAGLNPIEYFSYWYTSFIADISTLAGNYFLIALPAVFLPYGIGTSVTFIACLVSLSAVFVMFMRFTTTKKRNRFLSITIVFCFTYLSWLTYWIVLGRGNSGNEISRGTVGDLVFFGSIMNWQAANINYVILPCIALLIYSKMFTKNFSSWNPIVVVVFGLIIGGSFYVLSSVFILLILSQLVFNYFKYDEATIKAFKNEVLVLIFALLSLAASYFSPGAQTRRLNYTQDVPILSIPKTVVEGIFDWFPTLYLPALLITFLLGATLFRVFAYLKINEMNLDVSKFVVTPFILSLLTFVVTKVSEMFAYKAWWHELSSRTYLFIAVFTFGMYCMQILVKRIRLEFTLLELVVFSTAIFVALYAVKQSSDAIIERKIRWEQGPAQVTPNMDPFDRETAWVNECWIQLEEKRI